MGFLDPPGLTTAATIQLLGPALSEDPEDPGTYVHNLRVTEDPADPGTFLIGA